MDAKREFDFFYKKWQFRKEAFGNSDSQNKVTKILKDKNEYADLFTWKHFKFCYFHIKCIETALLMN